MEKTEQQHRNGVFCAIRAEILYAGQLVRVSAVQGSEELVGELVS
jgi:hypothetical protein